MATTIGELKKIKDSLEVEWQILDFFSLSEEQNVSYKSPVFDFAGASWYIKLYPNGHTERNSTGKIDFYLIKTESRHSIGLTYELGLKKADGSLDKKCSYAAKFEEKADGRGCTNVISRFQLLERKSDLTPSNILRIICKITRDESNIDSSISFRKTDTLSNDLRQLMINGKDSDLIIKLNEKEFRLHKLILGVRSPTFLTMINNEMKENAVNIVNIFDCDENVFMLFLEYVYTGSVNGDELQSNVFALYKLAEKYKIIELKEECLKFMKDKLTTETFFDAVELAEEYDEKELKLFITKFCSDNLKDLVKNPKWLIFMEEKTKKAYELLSTAITNYVKS